VAMMVIRTVSSG